MGNLEINGVECMTLQDIAQLSGFTVDALRLRQQRGTLTLEPFITISGQNFYEAEQIRSLLRQGLSK